MDDRSLSLRSPCIRARLHDSHFVLVALFILPQRQNHVLMPILFASSRIFSVLHISSLVLRSISLSVSFAGRRERGFFQ